VNLLDIGVFRSLVGDRDRIATAWQYMGPETKDIARKVARVHRRDQNLPGDG
jgi:hypothetical protein